MSSILKTDDLIKSIKRRAMVPTSQETFKDEDFLEMATEEVNIGLMSYIIKLHEEYLVYYEDQDIVSDNNRFPIPARAHGNKTRDIAILDNSGNYKELFRVSLEELSDYKGSFSYSFNDIFYLQNNEIVLPVQTTTARKMRIFFYMRPNKLVKTNRGAAISSISDSVEIDNISPLNGSITAITSGAITTITSTNHGLETGNKIVIQASDSTPSINGVRTVTVIDSNQFTIDLVTTADGTTGLWDKAIDVKLLTLDSFPKHFDTNIKYDFVSHKSPNKIVKYSISINDLDDTVRTISLPADVWNGLQVGDYITKEEETIVPNIPTELHPILAQRVAVACLEALGDTQGKQNAMQKLQEMENNALTLMDNRVEGAPQKIKARHSPLAQTTNQRQYRRRGL